MINTNSLIDDVIKSKILLCYEYFGLKVFTYFFCSKNSYIHMYTSYSTFRNGDHVSYH